MLLYNSFVGFDDEFEFGALPILSESPLTIVIWVLCLVATLCLLISKHGVLPRHMMFNPIMGMAVNLIFGSLCDGHEHPVLL